MDWRKIKAVEDDRQEIAEKMTAILELAEAEDRDIEPKEQTEFDELRAKAEKLEKIVTRMREAYHTGLPVNPGPGLEVYRSQIGEGVSYTRDTGTAFGLEKRFVDMVPRQPTGDRQLSLGKFLRGAALGDWTGAELERRAMVEGTSSAGGVLVPTPLSAFLIDVARNQAQCFVAGAQTIPMTAATLKVARADTDVSPGWKAEGSAFAQTGQTFDSVTLTAKMLGGTTAISLELLQDAVNLDAVATGSITKAMALALDYAILLGSGTGNQPTGILNTSGIQTVGSTGSPATPTDFSQYNTAASNIRGVNGNPGAVLLSPRTAGTLFGLQDTLHQPLQMPKSIDTLKWLQTNQLPNNLGSGTNQSVAVMGDYSNVLVGIRQNLMIEMTREGTDAAGLGFSTGHVLLRFYLRADVAIAHANQFCQIVGITA